MKKRHFLITLLVILCFVGSAYAAVTLVSSQSGKSGFAANGNSADLSACETIKAAVAGKSIYLESVTISSGAAITVTIGAGETASGVTAVIVGPVYMAANTTQVIPLPRTVVLAAATALTADASGAGNVTILAQGYIR